MLPAIYIRDEGVIGVALDWYRTGIKAMWFVDGIKYTSFLTEDEFREIDGTFEGEDDE